MRSKTMRWLSAVLVVLAVLVVVGRPHAFTDPTTHADGGLVATWGPVTCAVWTWSQPDVVSTGPPFNCFST